MEKFMKKFANWEYISEAEPSKTCPDCHFVAYYHLCHGGSSYYQCENCGQDVKKGDSEKYKGEINFTPEEAKSMFFFILKKAYEDKDKQAEELCEQIRERNHVSFEKEK